MKRRTLVCAGLLGAGTPWGWAAPASLKPVTVWAQGLHRSSQLPLLLAHKLGFFALEGLAVQIQPVPTQLRSLSELAEVPATVFAGTFERTLYLNAHGQPHQAFALMTRSPQVVLGLSARQHPSTASLNELVGARVAVMSTGSMGHRVAQLMLLRAGLKSSDVQFVEHPEYDQAIIAFIKGEVDAVSFTDPLISRLERTGNLRVLMDTRDLRVCHQLFGGPVATVALSAPRDWLEKSPDIAQGLTNGVVRALKWLQTAGPSDLVRHVPESAMGGDRSVFLAGFMHSRETFTPDGLFPDHSARNVMRALDRLRLAADLGQVDPDATWTNRFAVRAKQRFRV